MAVQTRNAKTCVTCHTAEWLVQEQINLWRNCLLTRSCTLRDTQIALNPQLLLIVGWLLTTDFITHSSLSILTADKHRNLQANRWKAEAKLQQSHPHRQVHSWAAHGNCDYYHLSSAGMSFELWAISGSWLHCRRCGRTIWFHSGCSCNKWVISPSRWWILTYACHFFLYSNHIASSSLSLLADCL